MGGYGILITTPFRIAEQFLRVKEAYGKTGGKQILHIVFSIERTLGLTSVQIKDLGYCIILSPPLSTALFALLPYYSVPIKDLGYMLADYFGKERQVIFAVHDDTGHLHIHMGITP